MSTDQRRTGDSRPYNRGYSERISWKLNHNAPFRWLPRHGEPWCVMEWLSQQVVKTLAFLPVYIAIVVTLTLYVVLFGVPFVDGGK
jgi:hypothetical protein